MLNWAFMFLIIAIIAGALGVSGVAGTASYIAWIALVIASVLRAREGATESATEHRQVSSASAGLASA